MASRTTGTTTTTTLTASERRKAHRKANPKRGSVTLTKEMILKAVDRSDGPFGIPGATDKPYTDADADGFLADHAAHRKAGETGQAAQITKEIKANTPNADGLYPEQVKAAATDADADADAS